VPPLPVMDQKLSQECEGRALRPPQRPPSLDPEKQLETTDLKFAKRPGQKPEKRPGLRINCREWLRQQLTKNEQERQQRILQAQVIRSVKRIIRRKQKNAFDPVKSWAAVCREWRRVLQEQQRRQDEEDAPACYRRVNEWMEQNPPPRQMAEWLKWEKTLHALQGCGRDWIVWRAACCDDRTAPVAVMVGCGHRLCPECAWRRAQRGRVRLKVMTDVFSHPVLITYTVPNMPNLDQKKIGRFRGALKRALKQRSAGDLVCSCGHDRAAHLIGDEGKRPCRLHTCQHQDCACDRWRPRPVTDRGEYGILGGVYAIETTFSGYDHSWHPHGHVLADLNHPLPPKYIEVKGRRRENKVDFFGKRVWAFIPLKMRLEFEWVQLTTGGKWGSKPAADPPAKSWKAKAKWQAARAKHEELFEKWVRAAREHSTYHFTVKAGRRRRVPKPDLTDAQLAEYERCRRWNAVHRRAVDIRPVKDRDDACAEVLKYITKVAGFSRNDRAVETFCNATRGLRMVQTFGSFYGFDLAASFDPQHLDDWGKRECVCGLNVWEKDPRIAHRGDVYMEPTGRWRPCLTFGRDGPTHGPHRIRGQDDAREEVA